METRYGSGESGGPTSKVGVKTQGQILSEISAGMVALLKEFYGVGPSEAKTYYQDDLVVCILRGGFTRVEQTLKSGGHGSVVIEQRMAFQEVMRERFEQVIAAATGQRVIGFMSGNQQDPDMICEVFVLDSASGPSDPGRERRRAREIADSRPAEVE